MAAIVKEFKPNKRYIFSKSRFSKNMFRDPNKLDTWVIDADGKEVTGYDYTIREFYIKSSASTIGKWYVKPEWCKLIR